MTDTRRAEFVEALDYLQTKCDDWHGATRHEIAVAEHNIEEARAEVLRLWDAATAVQGGEPVAWRYGKNASAWNNYATSKPDAADIQVYGIEYAYAAAPPVQVKGEAVALEPTPSMIEAGAQRLVSWEDGCVWPDSWDALQVAAARNEAERVWRSMWLAAPPAARQDEGRDAARYRFIRDRMPNASVIAWTQGPHPHIEQGKALDDAIDAAMSWEAKG